MSLRVWFSVVLFAVVMALGFPDTARAQAPTSFAEYQRALAETLDLIDRAAQAAPDARQPLLDQAASTLTAVRLVQGPDGVPVPVNNDTLAETVHGAAQDPAHARAGVQALRDSLADPPRAADPAARARLRALLSQPPYATPSDDSVNAQLQRTLSEWLDEVLSRTADGIYDQRRWFVLGGVMLVALVLVFVLRSLRRNAAAESVRPDTAEAEGGATAEEAFTRAQALIAAQDYRGAVRQMYLGALRRLDERGLLRYDRALTNREYLQMLQDARTRAALQPIVETFDRVWYGFETISPQEFQTYTSEVDVVQNL